MFRLATALVLSGLVLTAVSIDEASAQRFEKFDFAKDLTLDLDAGWAENTVAGQITATDPTGDTPIFDITGLKTGTQYDLEFQDPTTKTTIWNGRFSELFLDPAAPFDKTTLLFPSIAPEDPVLYRAGKENVFAAMTVEPLLQEPLDGTFLDALANFDFAPQKIESSLTEEQRAALGSLESSGAIQIVSITDNNNLLDQYVVVAAGFEARVDAIATNFNIALATPVAPMAAREHYARLIAPSGNVLDPTWDETEMQSGCAARLKEAISPPLLKVTVSPEGAGCDYVVEVRGRVPDFGIPISDWRNWHYKLEYLVAVYAWRKPGSDIYSDLIRIDPAGGVSVSSSIEDTDAVDRIFSPIAIPNDRDKAVFDAVSDRIIAKLSEAFRASLL